MKTSKRQRQSQVISKNNPRVQRVIEMKEPRKICFSDGEARQIAGIVGGLTYVPKALPNEEVVLDGPRARVVYDLERES